jgi:hypothetical protein
LGRIVRFLLLAFGVREGWAMFQAVKKEAREQREQRQDPGPPLL